MTITGVGQQETAQVPGDSPKLPPISTTVQLGRLISMDVRDQWADEAKDFTPWLAQPDNLRLLGEAIDMELEPFRVEDRIGPFRADIVAKEGDELVIIENQLGPTDHKHLGQLLVYATNRSAKAVVWVATTITDEYRKVLDWLNENTPDTIGFYGLEIELWRIGDSLPAPKFNVVCQPNELVKLERGGSSGTEPTETKLLQRDFWQALVDHAAERSSSLSFRKPGLRHWLNFAVGRTGFRIALTINRFQQRFGCELYISHPEAARAFDLLAVQKDDIEADLGELDWRPLPDKHACRIVQFRDGVLEDRESWPALLDWCLDRVESFQAVFAPRIQALDLDVATANASHVVSD